MSSRVISNLPSDPEDLGQLKRLLLRKAPDFYSLLRQLTSEARGLDEVLMLSSLRKKASRQGFVLPQQMMRIAVLGGYTTHPMSELVAHFLGVGSSSASWNAEFLIGEYDNYHAEILEQSSVLYEFKPELIMFLPSHRHCQYSGHLFDARGRQEAEARNHASRILELCRVANERTGAEIILANFPLFARLDLGAYRTRTLGSDWSFRKLVNLELGVGAPPYVHICDVEFLSARRGTVEAWDARAWFNSKQPYGPELMLDVSKEVAYLISSLRQSSKKVAVLDLDNTLWGGIIGEDGLEGIEIGDTSPRGEAFKAFQRYLLALTNRGVLLAVCSKNDYDRAAEAFEKHPEMVLRLKDFVAFKANWQPKSENIKQIAKELNLGLDSLVFIDDNPAEIELVKQFIPEVDTLLLGPDPSEYVGDLQDARFFEVRHIASEDTERVLYYKQEAQRQAALSCTTDMNTYLESLHMEAVIREFRVVDVPRITQLINKSNQFNFTTRRRTEKQVQALIENPEYFHFSVRLSDRFGDYGLIALVIGRLSVDEAEIDTWVMSCRVLKRQIEDEVMNQIVRSVRRHHCPCIRGVYLPTAKNGMVRDVYSSFGFTSVVAKEDRLEFALNPKLYETRTSKIRVVEQPYDAN